jgi:hypothetical protein
MAAEEHDTETFRDTGQRHSVLRSILSRGVIDVPLADRNLAVKPLADTSPML